MELTVVMFGISTNPFGGALRETYGECIGVLPGCGCVGLETETCRTASRTLHLPQRITRR